MIDESAISAEIARLVLEIAKLPDDPESTHASISHSTLQISYLRLMVAREAMRMESDDDKKRAYAADALPKYSRLLQEWEKRKAAAEANLIRDLYEEILENQRKRMDAKARLAPIATD